MWALNQVARVLFPAFRMTWLVEEMERKMAEELDFRWVVQVYFEGGLGGSAVWGWMLTTLPVSKVCYESIVCGWVLWGALAQRKCNMLSIFDAIVLASPSILVLRLHQCDVFNKD